MRSLFIGITLGVAVVALAFSEDWLQWGQNPSRILANLTYDPFVPQEQAEEGGELLAHYQTPLVQNQDVFMEFKSGTYVNCNPPGTFEPYPCGPDNWNNQTWSERRLHWEGGALVTKWEFASDWKPEPDASGELGDWEPVFHAAVSNYHIYVPGLGGTVWKLNQGGQVETHFNPFGKSVDPTIFVVGPLTVD